ncbi:Gfo/Idh/MocA family oxidoreductase [candidate division KSB1 bacterium]|nr:Gfo/Idh/MocA family oxidoreductase [candidate division KSB1 bacterium]
MQNIKTAIIGAGFMGPAHTEALRRLGVQVVGILGVDQAESDKAAESLGIPKAYASFEDVLKDKEVQVVHLTTPNKLHFPMAKAVLKAGKHVLCEKPLAMTSAETKELVALAKETGLAAGVNYNMRFYPLCLQAKDMVQTGEAGEIHSIVGSYVQDWLLKDTDYNWRVLAEEGGAVRAIGDIGTHWMDMVQNITGLKIVEVLADLKILHPVRKRPKGEVETFSGKVQDIQATENVDIITEDCGSVLLRFNNGASGNLWVSQATAGRKNCLRYEISGSKTALYWDSESPNEIWVGQRDKANERMLKDPGLASDAVRPYIGYPGGHNEGYPDSFKQSFRAFYHFIAAGDPSATPQFATFEEGHHEVVLCEAILKSHKEKKWITV